MIAEPHHIIARCQWKTLFDDDQQGFQLQEILSYFSHEVMPQIVDKVLSGFCAPQFHWRIERLTVDLGKLDYHDLLEQLTHRFADALYTALWRELQKLPAIAQRQILIDERNQQYASLNHALNGDFGADQSLSSHLTELATKNIALMAYFWQFGRLPWWHSQASLAVNQQQLFDQQLACDGDEVAKLVRRLGVKQVVRKRIAYQYQDGSIKHLIEMLEPSNHQQIIAFADDLHHSQWRKKTINANANEFAKVRWFWVLTHLLVERGSVFNSKMFILSTLKQMANHYSVDLEALLGHILRLSLIHI